MNELSDKIANIAFWIAIPTIRLTENSPYKYIRVIGLLGAFIFLPLVFIGLPLLFIAAIVGIFEDI